MMHEAESRCCAWTVCPAVCPDGPWVAIESSKQHSMGVRGYYCRSQLTREKMKSHRQFCSFSEDRELARWTWTVWLHPVGGQTMPPHSRKGLEKDAHVNLLWYLAFSALCSSSPRAAALKESNSLVPLIL